MAGVFQNHRRDDISQDAQRIHSRLTDRFGDDLVYIDLEDIHLGVFTRPQPDNSGVTREST